ncbi:hypothetical protein EJ02DRAFT_122351 [Clathrospora elynae]|uniref:Secreted protein n=1 Tax=Clathrospora elynae TaxID=706981 RepID=A0A6A5SV79_9PLEO|nr:hypothetical protein EJ02DRAFT_122351 [Clathrospora elynae]
MTTGLRLSFTVVALSALSPRTVTVTKLVCDAWIEALIKDCWSTLHHQSKLALCAFRTEHESPRFSFIRIMINLSGDTRTAEPSALSMPYSEQPLYRRM